MTSPHAARFDTGGGVTAGYELRPIPWVGIEARFSAVWLPSTNAAPTVDGFGSYYAPALGARAYPLADLGVGDLWVGASAALVITGDVVRPGLELGIGYELDLAGWLRAGPVLRYHHTFQTERSLPGASDAGFLFVGLSAALPGVSADVRDGDGDGIPDARDRCPAEPEDLDSFEDEDGCPDLDDDADGVPDRTDACPREPEDADGQDDEDGCPDADQDGDGDGIPDARDACPTEAEDRDGHDDEDGCPDLDDDGDGIPDASDACPRAAETINQHEDGDGCPDEVPPRTEMEMQLERLGERVLFPRNRVQLLGTSRPAIRAVIQLLQEHPEIRLLRVEAHASAEGDTEENLELSRRRAERVIALIVEGGIERDRLEAQAFGDRQPEFDGGTEEDHARNRRVVFVVVRSAAP
ncbi:MAG: OmpA family protein [Myxococcota bacterium]|nr:OmpA family protein [Myxococcota bacterium]